MVTVKLRTLTGTEDPALLAPAYGGDVERPGEILEQTRRFLVTHPRAEPWGAYLACDQDTPVGVAAYKSAPNAIGEVEIAYSTFPVYERRGYARAIIAALLDLGFRSGASTIVAHTLAEDNPSNAALRRHGFSFAGEVTDPEDGLVWRWKKRQG